MGVQIILYQVNLLYISVICTDDLIHELGIISTRPLLSGLGVAKAPIHVISQQNHARTLPDILIVFLSCFAWFDPKASHYFIQELTGPLIETQTGPLSDYWPVINGQHIFHFGQIFAIYLTDTPHRRTALFFKPRLDRAAGRLTFFKVNRTDSSSM